MPDPDDILDWRRHHQGAEADDYSPDAHAAAVDAALGLHEPGEQIKVAALPTLTTATDQMRAFADWLAPFKLSPGALKAVGLRTLALCWMAGAGPCRGLSQRAVADLLGLTRASMSHACREIAAKTGLQARGMRSGAAVAAYRAVAVGGWHRRRVNNGYAHKAQQTVNVMPGADAWLRARGDRRVLLVELGRIELAADRRAALQELMASNPRKRIEALRIVRSHAGGKKSVRPAERGGLCVVR